MFSWLKREEALVIEWKCEADTEKVPDGFFRILWPGGKQTRGFKHKVFGTYWETTGKEEALRKIGAVIPTDDELEKLPIVRRQAPTPSVVRGVANLPNGGKVVQVGDEGSNLPGESADYVGWDDASSGISGKEYARRANIDHQLF